MQLKRFKHILDLLLGIGLLLLMSYQVTGEAGHEWTGISMTILMLLHQAVNARWYAALFRGRYSPLRAVQTLINMALLLCFLLTALCGVKPHTTEVACFQGFSPRTAFLPYSRNSATTVLCRQCRIQAN